jgi:hypothetical protein
MWLLTNFGFFSIVEKPDDKTAGTLTIRSRVKADLEVLRDRYLPNMQQIEANAGSDYKFRARASREEIAAGIQQAIRDLDYSNFKNSVASTQGHKRASLYHAVWDVLYRLQDES